MSKKIAIFGAGVGGLVVCHELVKLGYKIDIYERKKNIGGMARSSRDREGYPTEYCWRVYFGFYENLFKIFDDLDIRKHLIEYKHENLCDATTFSDKINAFFSILYGVTSCDERLNYMDKYSWNRSSPSEHKSVYSQVAPVLGLDRKKSSYNSVIRVAVEDWYYRDKKSYILDGPTSEIWLDIWKKKLQDMGVVFHTESYIEKIEQNEFFVNENGILNKIYADKYILSVPIEELSRLFPNNNNLSLLKNLASQVQFTVQIYFNRNSLDQFCNSECNAFLVVGSLWDLIVLIYPDSFGTSTIGWSVAVCTANVKGHNGKTAMECEWTELIDEIWTQLRSCEKLGNILPSDHTKVVKKWTNLWEIGEGGYLAQHILKTEPKFSNNVGTLQLRPSFKISDNTYISTAYIKETIDIFSMEAATIAGKTVANDIDSRVPVPIRTKRPGRFQLFRAIDRVMYECGIPNLWILYVIILFALIFLIIKSCF